MDQAANLFEVLAWSFSLKSVLRTANIIDVSQDTNAFMHHVLGKSSEGLLHGAIGVIIKMLDKALVNKEREHRYDFILRK